MKTALVGALVLTCLTGCAANGFEKYYSPIGRAASVRVEPFSGQPAIYAYSEDPKTDSLHAQENGYVPLGASSFYGPANIMTRNQLIEQAKNVGAAMVLVRSRYKDTLSGIVPYTVANPMQISTVNTVGTVSANGATGSYTGQSTITSPGGSTTYSIPYSVTRNDTVATFFARQDPKSIRLGVIYRPLPDDLRTRLERNTGVVAIGIIKGTPAFNANIIPGDVLLRMGGEDITDGEHFNHQLAQFAGQTVDIDLVRGDHPKTIRLTLNPAL